MSTRKKSICKWFKGWKIRNWGWRLQRRGSKNGETEESKCTEQREKFIWVFGSYILLSDLCLFKARPPLQFWYFFSREMKSNVSSLEGPVLVSANEICLCDFQVWTSQGAGLWEINHQHDKLHSDCQASKAVLRLSNQHLTELPTGNQYIHSPAPDLSSINVPFGF